MYATRDDDNKSVFKIDLDTGYVTKLFSLNPTEPPSSKGSRSGRRRTERSCTC